MIEGNLLIRASAGTGKTFALATRFIRLMLLDGVAPERIVALTFSRAAAQEIYTKILERLWRAATDEGSAAQERETLLAGIDSGGLVAIEAKGIDWSAAGFARLLRRVIDTQHTGAIATLDSFILRIVRNFPLEMGFQRAVEVLDGPGEREALERATRDLLSRATGTEDFIAAFREARQGRMPRTLAGILDHMMNMEGWRKFILAHPESRAWTLASMTAALGLGRTEPPDLSAIPAPADRYDPVGKFVSFVEGYTGEAEVFPKNKCGELMRHLASHPDATDFGWTTESGTERHYEYGPAGAAAIRAGMRHVADLFLRRQLEIVAAKLRLFSLIEREYDAATRRAGRLTFQDFTDYSAASEDSAHGLDIQNLEFRFDSRFDHWALDEFQDTSEVQWRCLRRLVDSAATSGDGRTVIAVGDLKQSIYTWRGGDEAPFQEMMGWGAFREPHGRIADSCVSYRYQRNICDFLNALFGVDNLRKGALIPAARAAAVARWLAPDRWRPHEAPCRADGSPKADDYVTVIGVRPPEDAEGENVLQQILPTLADEVGRVWREHERVGSHEEIGILVRTNDEGMAIAEHLRGRGLPAVWEGMSAVADVPVVKAVVHLLRLAEHPEDTFAWRFVNDLLPVREILLPQDATAAAVSRRVASSLSCLGLARTLKEYCGTLCEDAHELDALSRERLRALVRVGVEYEGRGARDCDVDGFVRYLAATGRRESGTSSGVIRILTIHRSKGLTLDRVFVPIAEGDKGSILEAGASSVLYGKGCAWVLPHLDRDVALLNDETAPVFAAQCDERLLETLRTYYVALTRARKAMYVIQPLERGRNVHFRDLVEQAVSGFARREEGATVVLFEQGTEPAFVAPATSPATDVPEPLSCWTHDAPAVRIERVSPSTVARPAAGTGGHRPTAAGLFEAESGEAARQGTRVHERYRAIEWAEGDVLEELPEAFRAAFVRPTADATVWRERGYELFLDGCWESGQFDRVVFTGRDGDRRATVYDFKTNRRLPGEGETAFAARLKATYAEQMRLYRHAIAALTGMPPERVACVLLLTETGITLAM